jgi:predicted nucleic acid binding AN1-type Zn finger protein
MTHNQHYSIDNHKNTAMLREWQRKIDESKEDDEELLQCDDCSEASFIIETCDNCGDKLCMDCQYLDEDIVFCFQCFAERFVESEEI